jgi:hypothetical protein
MQLELIRLIQSLRHELMACAEISASLDRHIQFLALSSAGNIGATAGDVELKGKAVQHAREQRTRAQVTVARALELEADASMEEIIPLLPADRRALVIALVRAGRELIAQVALTLRRNQVSLRRAAARVRRFLNNVFPGHFDKASRVNAPGAVANDATDTVRPLIFAVEIATPKPAPFRFVASRHVPGFPAVGFLNVAPYSLRIKSKNGTHTTR